MTSCPTCRAEVRPADIDPELKVALCAGCGAVFGLTEGPPPGDVTVRRDGEAVVLEYAWFSVQCVAMGVFGAFWYAMLLVVFATGPSVERLWIIAIPGLWGMPLLYATAVHYRNRTVIRVERQGGLTVHHGPLPWTLRRPVDLAAVDVAQLYVNRREVMVKGQAQVHWDLMVLHQAGGVTTLIPSVRDEQRARFLERRIEQALGLEDRRVAWE